MVYYKKGSICHQDGSVLLSGQRGGIVFGILKMKKTVLCLLLVCAGSVMFAKAGDTMYVNVQESVLRDGTGFFAGKVGAVAYGDQVKITAEKGKWAEVVSTSDSSLRGWIPLSSLTKKKIVLQNGSLGVSASADELALAGKGFSAEVEDVFRQENNSLRYDMVDRIEKNTVSDSALYEFIVQGQLSGGEE